MIQRPHITAWRSKAPWATNAVFRKRFVVDNPWFSGQAEIATYHPEEILGTKLRALYQCKKGRDLFDLAAALEQIPSLDSAKVVDCFTRYLSHDGRRVSRAEFEANISAKLGDTAFTADILPLLVREDVFESTGAAVEPRHFALRDSTAYLANWIKVLEGDTRLVITAAAQAQRAADLVLGRNVEGQLAAVA